MRNASMTFSSELMVNYMHARALSPEHAFEALQTRTGLSLLFSIGSDGAFCLTEETAASATGWERQNLSDALIARDFPGKQGVVCKTFSVAQHAATGTFGIALVLHDGTHDILYLSLGNPGDAPLRPDWTAFPFDDSKHPRSPLVIAGVQISETSEGEYILADVLRDPGNPASAVFRYWLDPDKSTGAAWVPHTLAADFTHDAYQSCLGRSGGDDVDTVYTIGHTGAQAQFICQPLYNAFDPAVPAPAARLHLTGNLLPEALATCRDDNDETGLFVAAQGELHYFPADNQADHTQSTVLIRHPFFTRIRKLFAYQHETEIIVWGWNGANEVSCTKCPLGSLSDPEAWSVPLPILTGVDMLSPYLNRVDNGHTVFAAAGATLYKLVQSPSTTLWSTQEVHLPVEDTQAPALRFTSYTTRIQVLAEDNLPGTGTVMIAASTRSTCYINNAYYVLGETPLPVPLDAMGCLTLTERTEGLQGTRLFLSDEDGNSLSINPMEKPVGKVSAMDTVASLRTATIRDGNGDTHPLMAPDCPEEDLQAVAAFNQNLRTASLQLEAALQRRTLLGVTSLPEGIFGGIATEAGHLFHHLKSGVAYACHLVEDTATGLWHFVARIAGEVYHAVLDCVEKIAASVEWIYQAVKTGVEKLLKFLSYLFEWQDIKRTKEVLYTLTRLYLRHQADQLLVMKQHFDGQMDAAKAAIARWAGLPDLSGLGEALGQPATRQANPASGHDSGTDFLSHHFRHNAGNSTTGPLPDPGTPDPNPIHVLFTALEREGEVLGEALDQLRVLAGEFRHLSLEQLLKRIAGILGEAVLGSVQVVTDVLFDLLYDLITAALQVLDTPIHVPVVSHILAEIGVPEFSLLDLMCWLGAVPVTLLSKTIHGHTPFPDDAHTRFLIQATDFSTVEQAFRSPQRPASNDHYDWRKTVFTAGHGFCAIFTGLATLSSCFEAPIPARESNPYSTFSSVLDVLAAVSAGVANALVPMHPLRDPAASGLSTGVTGVQLLLKVVFCGPGQKFFGNRTAVLKHLKVSDARGTGALLDALLVSPAAMCTLWHFEELSRVPASTNRTAAILDELSNVTSYLSRISYAVAVNAEAAAPEAIVVLALSGAGCTGLQFAESFMDITPEG